MDILNLTSELTPDELHKLLADLQQSQATRLVCKTQETTINMDFACPPNFDSVLCWPHTPPDTMAILPCMDDLNGIKYDTSREYNDESTRMCVLVWLLMMFQIGSTPMQSCAVLGIRVSSE